MIQIHHGDCLDVLHTLPDNSADSIVTDPPYGLKFMGRRWDYDVPSVEIWAECLRVLKPGGHLLAFAGTRTQHRMCTRIEDAGFEIRDMIAWIYGSGFPKSHNGPWGGTALKPALEPITMARKPLEGTVAANVLAYGTGALNIDGCRVGTGDDRASGGLDGKKADATTALGGAWAGVRHERPTGGRWPANLIHDGSDEVVGAFPQVSPCGNVGSSTGRATTVDDVYSPRGARECGGIFSRERIPGSAARFFYCAKASKRDRDEGLDGFEAKPANSAYGDGLNTATKIRTEEQAEIGVSRELRRNNHPTVKPTDLMRYLCRLVTPPGGMVLDPFMGSGSTGKAAVLEGFGFIGIEREAEYAAIAEARCASAFEAGFRDSYGE